MHSAVARPIGLLLMASAASAMAQTGGASEFRLAPYLWSAGFKGTIGATDSAGRVDGNFSGLADNLDISGIMLYADWRRDRWSVFGDWAHFKVKSSAPSPLGALYSGVEGEIRGNVGEIAAGYQVAGDAMSKLDVFAGLRYYDLDGQMTLQPAALAARHLSGSDAWTDGVVGARWRGRIGDKWELVAYGDFGAGGSDLSWQAAATVSYAFSWGQVAGGWRHLDVDYEKGGFKVDAALSGPFLGAIFKF